MVEQALESHEVDPAEFQLEITESQIMARPVRALATLRQLADLGVALSIDDFGAGQSSLAYVRQLPVSELKVDRSFCMELDERNLVILRSAIAMGHDLGMHVTAEGVESREVLDELRQLGCDHAQGYLIGEAMLAQKMARRMRRVAVSRVAP